MVQTWSMPAAYELRLLTVFILSELNIKISIYFYFSLTFNPFIFNKIALPHLICPCYFREKLCSKMYLGIKYRFESFVRCEARFWAGNWSPEIISHLKMKIQPGFKFGKRVLEAHVRILEAITARKARPASWEIFAHVCGVEAQLANIRHKSNSIIN